MFGSILCNHDELEVLMKGPGNSLHFPMCSQPRSTQTPKSVFEDSTTSLAMNFRESYRQ